MTTAMSEPGKIGNLARVGAVVLCAVAAGLWWTKQDGSGDEAVELLKNPKSPLMLKKVAENLLAR